ncbi:DUF3489 domain-containing protein [Castellaniella defragrans]|uniref:DUF3489 domain-containing protein n=1 Tax=Castellaniella defragrans TaxID=75697 RepID=UPI0005B893CC|nr:DUF3489 domain-containing protein [Castellaniella defragrans]
MTKLTTTQLAILHRAAQAQGDGRIYWYPDNLKGGARQKVISALAKQELITDVDGAWHVSDAGYQALDEQGGGDVATKTHHAPVEADPELDQAVQAAQRQWAAGDAPQPARGPAAAAPQRPTLARAGSKQALVLELLQRPEGASIAQIMDATGWQAHTVRGTFAGAFKKKLGLAITSDKAQGEERVYRIGE